MWPCVCSNRRQIEGPSWNSAAAWREQHLCTHEDQQAWGALQLDAGTHQPAPTQPLPLCTAGVHSPPTAYSCAARCGKYERWAINAEGCCCAEFFPAPHAFSVGIQRLLPLSSWKGDGHSLIISALATSCQGLQLIHILSDLFSSLSSLLCYLFHCNTLRQINLQVYLSPKGTSLLSALLCVLCCFLSSPHAHHQTCPTDNTSERDRMKDKKQEQLSL